MELVIGNMCHSCVGSSSPWLPPLTFGRFTVLQDTVINLETAHKTRQRCRVCFLFFFVFFSHKGGLVGECQIVVISNTDNHVTPRPLSALVHVSLCLSAADSLSQVRDSSCRRHMMSCGLVLGAEQWQFYPQRHLIDTLFPVTCAHSAELRLLRNVGVHVGNRAPQQLVAKAHLPSNSRQRGRDCYTWQKTGGKKLHHCTGTVGVDSKSARTQASWSVYCDTEDCLQCNYLWHKLMIYIASLNDSSKLRQLAMEMEIFLSGVQSTVGGLKKKTWNLRQFCGYSVETLGINYRCKYN